LKKQLILFYSKTTLKPNLKVMLVYSKSKVIQF